MVTQSWVSGSSKCWARLILSLRPKNNNNKCFCLIMLPVQLLRLWRHNSHCVCFLCQQIKILRPRTELGSLSVIRAVIWQRFAHCLGFFFAGKGWNLLQVMSERFWTVCITFFGAEYSGWAGSFVFFWFYFFIISVNGIILIVFSSKSHWIPTHGPSLQLGFAFLVRWRLYCRDKVTYQMNEEIEFLHKETWSGRFSNAS